MENAPLVKHKGKHYLEYKAESVQSVEYFDEQGNALSAEQVAPFLPKKRHSATQDKLDKKVILRDVDVENILSLRISKRVFLG